MEQINQQELKQMQVVSSLKGMAVISATNGEDLGSVEDVLVDPGQLTIEALALVKGGFLRQDVYLIPTTEVQVWGKDVILVRNPESMRKRSTMKELDHARPAGSLLRGMEVISVTGERYGELSDLLIDEQGRLHGIEVSRASDRLAKMQKNRERGRPVRLPVSYIHSMGKDVLILNLDKAEEAAVESEPVVEEAAAAPPVVAAPAVEAAPPVAETTDVVEQPQVVEEETRLITEDEMLASGSGNIEEASERHESVSEKP